MSYQQIQASEIANYVYCRRAWHLRQMKGHASQNVRELADGRRHHQAHGRSLRKSFWAQRLAYALLFITVTFIAFQILMGL
ncbi:MAG: hypothetical protein GY803_13585 [Chloroflexi bacterium]|nr:hypothetical protein [Chloroflexota bacterium]